jgi:N-acyl amino acid synthase of PEP-CTERM/exosortase system
MAVTAQAASGQSRAAAGTTVRTLPPYRFAEANPPTGGRDAGEHRFDDFEWVDLDKDPRLLRESFRLRYEAYCERQGFLDPSEYPDGLERDAFDDDSSHIGVVHRATGLLTATARIVYGPAFSGASPLPLSGHCTLTEPAEGLLNQTRYVGEISRFVLSSPAIATIVSRHPAAELRRSSLSAMLTLYKSIYQTGRITGTAVLVAAMEKSLRRLVTRFSFPFHQIGPEVDYFGPVAPFLLDLDELDDVLFDEAPWLLAEFYDGLEAHNVQTEWSMRRQRNGRPFELGLNEVETAAA